MPELCETLCVRDEGQGTEHPERQQAQATPNVCVWRIVYVVL